MSYELWPETPHFVCCCGVVFFERDRDRMWVHAKEHAETNRFNRQAMERWNASASEPEVPSSGPTPPPVPDGPRAGA